MWLILLVAVRENFLSYLVCFCVCLNQKRIYFSAHNFYHMNYLLFYLYLYQNLFNIIGNVYSKLKYPVADILTETFIPMWYFMLV